MPTSCTDPGPPRRSTRPSARERWRAWRTRFARAFSRFVRFTTGTYIALLFAVAPVFGPFDSGPAALAQDQQDGAKEKIRFIDGKSELGEIVSADETGVMVRLERVEKPVLFEWWKLAPEQAGALRLRLLGKTAPAAPAGALTTAGVRVRTADGKSYEGIILAGAPPKELWLKNAEGRWVIALDTIVAREEATLAVQRVYSAEELTGLVVGRGRPLTAEEADRIGMELLRAKLQDRARAAFKLAEILRNPDRTESILYAELSRVRELVEDLAVRKSVYQAEESYLLGDYDAVLAQIDAAEKVAGLPEAAGRELRRLRAQIHEFRGLARDERIVQEGYRTIDLLLKARAMDRAAGFEASKAYAEGPLAAEVLEQVRRRLNFSPEDPALKLAWDRRGGPASKHSYEDGSWLVLRPDSRAPGPWWQAADDLTRFHVLKGFFIERHLTVLRSELKSCATCGGTGTLPAALCPSCLGIKAHRVVIYR